MDFSIATVINNLAEKRSVFTSEADFQFALAQIITETYPDNAKVRLEYCPELIEGMHLDILVLWTSGNENNRWIPIELKYRTNAFHVIDEDGCIYNLKDQGAQFCGCYDYLKDISRTELIKAKYKDRFKTGFAIFLTNDMLYIKGPRSNSVNYYDFRISNGRTIKCNEVLYWQRNAKYYVGRLDKITLNWTYDFNWQEYSTFPETSFSVLVSKIE